MRRRAPDKPPDLPYFNGYASARSRLRDGNRLRVVKASYRVFPNDSIAIVDAKKAIRRKHAISFCHGFTFNQTEAASILKGMSARRNKGMACATQHDRGIPASPQPCESAETKVDEDSACQFSARARSNDQG